MNTWEAADMLERMGSTEAARVLRDTVGRIEADTRALWAVRVLDAGEAQGVAFEQPAYGRVSQHWYIRSASYATADAARLAAAEAVFPTLPADVRAELGERP